MSQTSFWESANALGTICSAVAAIASAVAAFCSWRATRNQLSVQVAERRTKYLEELHRISLELAKGKPLLDTQIEQWEVSLRTFSLYFDDLTCDELIVKLKTYALGQDRFPLETDKILARVKIQEEIAKLAGQATNIVKIAAEIIKKH